MGDDLAETVKMLPQTMDDRGLCITRQRCVRRSAGTSSGQAVVDISGGGSRVSRDGENCV